MKRRLLIAAVFLLAGAVVNVAVAWGCCLTPGGRGEWLPTESPTAYLKSHFPDTRIGPQVHGGLWRGLGWHGWSAIDEQSHQALDLQAGWPTRTLEGYRVGKDLTLVSMSGLWHTRWPRGPRALYLPFHPIWPGVAINTVFYAGILAALFYSPFALRRFIRRRRGLCPACAYPMGETAVCTECGLVLQQS